MKSNFLFVSLNLNTIVQEKRQKHPRFKYYALKTLSIKNS